MAQAAFTVHEEREGAVQLRKALLIYERKESNGGAGQCHVTVHRVMSGEDGPIILSGHALTVQASTRLVRELSRQPRQGGFVPPELLYWSGDVVAWWAPPAARHIAIRNEAMGAPERGEVVPHPGLVFCVNGNKGWYVWAVRGSERPTPQTALFQAPYLNVWATGQICIGNVTVPDGNPVEQIEAWSRCFFGSFFTHTNAAAKLLKYEGGAYAFWRDMLDGKFSKFPERVLRPLGTTLARQIAAL
jgi:PRTRC genetic system protein B